MVTRNELIRSQFNLGTDFAGDALAQQSSNMARWIRRSNHPDEIPYITHILFP